MNPARLLLALFFVVPLLELYLLIKVGEWIGAIPTIFMVVFTAVLGLLLLRHQGFSTLQRARAMMERGEVPALEMLEGVMVMLGGALLLVPGFLTDILGVICLIPPLRRRLLAWFIRVQGVPPRPPGDAGPRVIEGEYRREDD